MWRGKTTHRLRPREGRGADGGDSPGSFQNSPALRLTATLDRGGCPHVPDPLVVRLDGRLSVRPCRICEVVRCANQERQMLRGCRITNGFTEIVSLANVIARVDEHQVIEIRPPLGKCFVDIRSAIHLDAEFPHDLGTQVTLVGRRIDQEYSVLLD